MKLHRPLPSIIFFQTKIWIPLFSSFSRPEFPGQRVHGYYPSGPVQALVLQGQLLHVQEDGDPEETRKVKLIIFVGEIHIKTRTNLL